MKLMAVLFVLLDINTFASVQRFSHRMQRFCGLNNFDLAKFCCHLMPVIFIASAINHWFTRAYADLVFDAFMLFSTCRSAKSYYEHITKREKVYGEPSAGSQVMNPDVAIRLPVRVILCICLIIFLLIFSLFNLTVRDNIQYILILDVMLCVEYFIACTPMPPGTSKVGALLKKFKKFGKSLVPTVQPTPVPVPTSN